MPGLNEEVTPEVVVDDRRATIEAAFEQAERAGAEEAKPIEAAPPPEPKQEAAPEEVKPAKAPAEEVEPAATSFSVEKAPQAWRAGAKAKWATIDPDARQEIVRREREITRVLGESAGARQLANQFGQAVQPFMARIQSMNAHPVQAIQELLKADHLLSTAPPAQRATFMAKLINDYGVDIKELDRVLSGQPPTNPLESQVEQLVQQRLAPIQQYFTHQQQLEQQRSQQTAAQISETVESMADNPKFPHFSELRDTMADVVEIMANRGLHISIEEAYNRAVAMDPTISKQVNDTQLAAQQNARAQRALKASTSVGGAPGGSLNGAPSTDRRATIAAAFDAVGGR